MTIYSKADFIGDNPPPRIIGTETERLAKGVGKDAPPEEGTDQFGSEFGSPDSTDPELYEFCSSENVQRTGLTASDNNQFINTGARLYVDAATVVEYASNEGLGPKAAEEETEKGNQLMVKMASVAIGKDGEPLDIEVYDRTGNINIGKVTDKYHKAYSSVGNHPNYLSTPRAVYSNRKKRLIASYLATSSSYSGAGMLWLPEDKEDKDENAFRFLQKSESIGGINNQGRTTPDNKAMLHVHNTENSAAGAPGWPRLEVRCMDYLTLRSARAFSYASMSLFLRMLERDFFSDEDLRILELLSPRDVLLEASADLDLKGVYKSITRDSISALSHQRFIAEKAMELTEKVNLPEDEVIAAHEWIAKCDALEAWRDSSDDPYERDDSLAYDHSEAIARLHVIKSKCGQTALNCLNFKASEIDIKWNRTYKKASKADTKLDRIYQPGIGEMWWQKSKKRYNPFNIEDLEPDAYKQTPPTRAEGRRDFITKYGNRASADWDKLKNLDTNKEFIQTDPYNPKFYLSKK